MGGALTSEVLISFLASLGDVSQIISADTFVNAEATVTTYVSGGQDFFVEETIRNRGPECFDDELNYDPPAVPSDSDTVLIEFAVSNIRWGTKQRDTFTVYSTADNIIQISTLRPLFQNGQKLYITTTGSAPGGLAADTAYYVINADKRGRFQLSTTEGGTAINITSAGSGTHTIGLRLASFIKRARYTGEIGLPRMNEGFEEYRPKYLEIYCTDEISLGEGDGSDSPLVRINTGNEPVPNGINIFNTSSSSEQNVPTIALLVNDSTTDINAYSGDIGLACHLDESSTVRDFNLYDCSLVSIGGTVCRNITGDKSTTIKGSFTPSGSINLNR